MAPAPRTRRQPSASTISGALISPRSVITVLPCAALDLGRLEGEVALRGQDLAQRPVIEGGEGPREVVAHGGHRGVDDELAERLAQGLLEAQRGQPRRRNAARRGLALADLVAVDDQNVGAAAGQLAGHGEPGKARAAHEDVAVALQGCALGAALGGSSGHRARMIGTRLGARLARAHKHGHRTSAVWWLSSGDLCPLPQL